MPDEKEPSNLEEIEEWQEHQFDPGYYYTGGKIHPSLKAPGKPILLAVWWFFAAGLWLLVYCLMVLYPFLTFAGFTSSFGDIKIDRVPTFIMMTIFFVLVILFNIWLGIRFCIKAKRQKEKYRKVYEQHSRQKKKR